MEDHRAKRQFVSSTDHCCFDFASIPGSCFFKNGGHDDSVGLVGHHNPAHSPLTKAVLGSRPAKCWCRSGTSFPGREPVLAVET